MSKRVPNSFLCFSSDMDYFNTMWNDDIVCWQISENMHMYGQIWTNMCKKPLGLWKDRGAPKWALPFLPHLRNHVPINGKVLSSIGFSLISLALLKSLYKARRLERIWANLYLYQACYEQFSKIKGKTVFCGAIGATNAWYYIYVAMHILFMVQDVSCAPKYNENDFRKIVSTSYRLGKNWKSVGRWTFVHKAYVGGI